MPRRRLVFSAIALLAGFLAVILAIPLLIDTAALKPLVKAQLEAASGKPVDFQSVKLNLFPLALRLDGLTVGNLLETPILEARVDLWPLLQKRVRIHSLRLQDPKIELIQDATGKWNFESPQPAASTSEPLTLDELLIQDAAIGLTQAGKPRSTFNRVNLRLRDIAPASNKAIQAELSAPLSVHNKDSLLEAEARITPHSPNSRSAQGKAALKGMTPPVSLSFNASQDGDKANIEQLDLHIGRTTARVKGAVTGNQLNLDIDVARTPIGEIAQLASQFGVILTPGLNVQGNLEAHVKARGPISQPAFQGTLYATSVRVTGKDLKQPVSTSDVTLDFTPEAIRSRPLTFECGPSRLNGHFSIRDYSAAAPKLEAALFAEQAQLDDLLEIAHAYGGAHEVNGAGSANLRVRLFGNPKLPASIQAAGKLLLSGATLRLDALAGKPLSVRRADIDFQGTRVQFQIDLDSLDTAWLATQSKRTAPSATPTLDAEGDVTVGKLMIGGFELLRASTHVRMKDGVIRLDPLSSTIYGGRHSGGLTIDLRKLIPRITIESRFEAVDSGRLIAVATPAARLLQGPLNAGATLEFDGESGPELMRSLNGRMHIDLARGEVGFMNLLGNLGKVARFVTPLGGAGGTTPFANLTGDLNFTNGEATTENLAITLPQGKVTAAGKLNLVSQALNLRLNTVLAKEYADQAGGTRIGGYLTAAILNSNGELVIPALLSGTFGQPQVTVDAGEIAKLKLRSTLPSLKDNPGAIVDAIKGKKEGVRGLIDIFSGRKKKDEEKK